LTDKDKRGEKIATRYITYEHIFTEELETTKEKFQKCLKDLQNEYDHRDFQPFLRGSLLTIDDNKRHEAKLRELLARSLRTNDIEIVMDVRCEIAYTCENGNSKVVDEWER